MACTQSGDPAHHDLHWTALTPSLLANPSKGIRLQSKCYAFLTAHFPAARLIIKYLKHFRFPLHIHRRVEARSAPGLQELLLRDTTNGCFSRLRISCQRHRRPQASRSDDFLPLGKVSWNPGIDISSLLPPTDISVSLPSRGG